MQLDGKKGNLINAVWLIRVLATSRRWHECEDCGGRMFVKARSGRCPVCFTRARRRSDEIAEIVAEGSLSALEDWTNAA